MPVLPSCLQSLLRNGSARDLVDFVPLVSQLTFRYKVREERGKKGVKGRKVEKKWLFYGQFGYFMVSLWSVYGQFMVIVSYGSSFYVIL